MKSRAVNAMLAIGCSLLPMPVLKLLEQFNRDCGDGLCGFVSGALALGILAIATAVFLVRSARRTEAPAVLRMVPLALWAMVLVPLTF